MKIRHLFVALPLAFFATPAFAEEEAENTGSVEHCMECHEDEDLTKTLGDGKELPMGVNLDLLEGSVHAGTDCVDCHVDYPTDDEHEAKEFKNAAESKKHFSSLCAECHEPDEGIHGKMLEKLTDATCLDCHGSTSGGKGGHDIKPISEMGGCMSCHKHEMSIVFADGTKALLQEDPKVLAHSVHDSHECIDCHSDYDEHPVIEFASHREMTAKLSGESCKQCHEDVFETYKESAHGAALFRKKNLDVPLCSDCHKSHAIKDPKASEFRNHVPQTCGACHANKELMDKYGLKSNVLETYLNDYHGVTSYFYIKEGKENTPVIAVCTDCHGIHDIMTARGDNSAVVKEKLVKRCQSCHPDATENFPDAWISHYEPSLDKAPAVFFVNVAYMFLIPFMIGGLLIHMFLHFWRYAIKKD